LVIRVIKGLVPSICSQLAFAVIHEIALRTVWNFAYCQAHKRRKVPLPL
jgi:hypothetical protein